GMTPPSLRVRRVAQPVEQLLQLVEAAVHVADDVERANLAAPVGPDGYALDARGVDGGDRAEGVDVAEALALQPAEALAQVAQVRADHARADVAVGAGAVVRDAGGLTQVEDDRHRQYVVLAGDADQMRAVLRLDVGRIHHAQLAAGEAHAEDVV